jgi:long-chain fatty acid transport protein
MRKLAPTLLALVLPATALAAGGLVPNLNPRDLAMSASLVAAQDGASAAYQNPSALSRIPGLSLSIAGSLIGVDDTWNTTTGLAPSRASTSTLTPPPSLFVSYGGKIGERGWGIGLGANVPAGASVSWPSDWPGRYDIIEADRKVFGAYLAAGFEVIPQIRIGGGAVYYYSTEKLSQAFSPVYPALTAQVADSGSGWSFDVSAEFQPVLSVPLVIGVDYKHQSYLNLTGDAHFNNVPPPLQTQIQDQSVSHQLVQPNELNVGVAYRASPKVLVTFQWTLDRLITYASDTFVGGKGITLSVPRNYGNGWTLRGGVEWMALKELALRAGFQYDYARFPTHTVSPSLPDGNSYSPSIGAGWYITDSLGVHAALFYSWFDQVTSAPPAFPGRYDLNVWIATVGFTWHWQPGEPVAQVSQEQAR